MTLPAHIKSSPRLVLLGSFGITSAVNYAFSLVMGWLLVPGDFGVLAFAQTLLLIAGLLLQSGIPWALAREVAIDDGAQRAALIRGALLANVGLAIVASGTIFGLFVAGPLQAGLETLAIAASVTATLPLIAVATVAYASAQGVENFGTMATLQASEVVTKAVAGTAFVVAGYGAGGAVFGFLIGSVFSAILGLAVLVRGFQMRLCRDFRLPEYRAAVPMFFALLGIVLLLNLHLLAVKLFLPDDRALTGYYQVAIILANTPYYLVAAVVLPVLFVQLSRYRSVAETAEQTGKALRLVALGIIPIELALALAPDLPVRALFPDAYLPAASYLRFLAAGGAMVVLCAVLSTTFQAIGRSAVPARIFIVGGVIEAGVLWVFLPRAGSTLAAIAFMVFAGVYLALLGGVYLRSLPAAGMHAAAHWGIRYVSVLAVTVCVAAVIMETLEKTMVSLAAGGAVYGILLILTGLAPLPSMPSGLAGPLRRALASRS